MLIAFFAVVGDVQALGFFFLGGTQADGLRDE
jgi:hypothetical protein